jgi:2-methylaconitate cis-trans-isomerase PrpF
MPQLKLRAVFMRGGTSNALMFRAEDLPSDRTAWDRISLGALGSPDPNGRQLDGMGGGISSLSKVCVIGPPTHPEADVDYTFAQVAIREAFVDYSGNCGNMSSAVGPFAVDEGIVKAAGPEAIVRIHNTNTRKLIVARFPMEDGKAAVEGDFVLPGVAGSGAPIRLEFISPGGAATGRLLPTGNVIDLLDIDGVGRIEASMVDAANPCVFVAAEALGLTGIEMPDQLERDLATMRRLEAIRVAASLRMGIAATPAEAARRPSIPKVAIVTGPRDASSLTGERLTADSCDVTIRMISIGQAHRAVPLTGAMCLAVAAQLPGSIVGSVARPSATFEAPIRIAQPSGLTVVASAIRREHDGWFAEHATFYRTARRLMEGFVFVRSSALN